MSSTTTNDNPLREGIRLERAADPCTVIIFGASGDLTKRKLVPALYRLTQERLLPAEFAILGFARSPMGDDAFRANMKDAIATYTEAKSVDETVWQSFAQGIFYVAGDINDPTCYQKMKERLDQIDRERGTAGNRVFYLSVSPNLYGEAIEQLGAAGLARPYEHLEETALDGACEHLRRVELLVRLVVETLEQLVGRGRVGPRVLVDLLRLRHAG